MNQQTFDAIVIGAGPGGGSAALNLARAGWRVAVIERNTFPRRKVCGEYLSATNLPLFEKLGLGELFREQSGPPVTHVGFFGGKTMLRADLPKPDGFTEYGRALSREHLDTLLLERAREAGAVVHQATSAESLVREQGGFCLTCEGKLGQFDYRAPVVIAAHGSWETGKLPTQLTKKTPHGSDLFGFKAHFSNSQLQPGLMPLLAFPGGYGGMVHCEQGKASISFCLRRDVLTDLRKATPGDAPGVAFGHVMKSCRGVREALGKADRVGAFLSTGPIRPGIRVKNLDGIFLVGNAAGEAHPVVAEGISMALQAGYLVAEQLIAWKLRGANHQELAPIGDDYANVWRSSFAPRIKAARWIAHWAMRPMAIRVSVPVMKVFPGLLTWGARLSGKATSVVAYPTGI